MGLHELTLNNFRPFASLRVEPDLDAITVFLSPNGSGKSSVLEAVHMLATGSSFRTTTAGDMVKNGHDHADVHGVLFAGPRRIAVDLELHRGPRATTKRMLVNGQKPRSRRDLADAIPLTVFTPESVDVIRGGPEGRRDLVMWQMTDATPSLSEVVERYARLITQRNALIRSLEGEWPTNTQREQLTAWSDEVASVGETLRAHRQDHLDVMTPLMKERYNELSGATEDVSLTYDASWEGSLRDALESSLRRDLSRGYTTVGPHRDDVAVMLDGRDARRQASQGEQRSLALAWRLAGHEHVRRERSVEPLLLLDDVFSELDPSRSARLLSLLPAGQTLVTTATPLPSGMNPARVVDLTKGAA